MENLIYILYICICAPLVLMLFIIDKKSKLTIAFMLLGTFLCLFVSEINAVLLRLFNYDVYYVTTAITPVTEEIIKALPIVFFGFLFCDDLDRLVTVSMALGIGFAILENSYILISNTDSATLFWALIRGFGSGLMHGISTSFVGVGMSFVHKKKKLFYTGTFGILICTIMYHSIYNTLVQSSFQIAGFLLPIVTFIPLCIFVYRKKNIEIF